MALAWKAGWVNALGGSNPPSSADCPFRKPREGLFRCVFAVLAYKPQNTPENTAGHYPKGYKPGYKPKRKGVQQNA